MAFKVWLLKRKKRKRFPNDSVETVPDRRLAEWPTTTEARVTHNCFWWSGTTRFCSTNGWGTLNIAMETYRRSHVTAMRTAPCLPVCTSVGRPEASEVIRCVVATRTTRAVAFYCSICSRTDLLVGIRSMLVIQSWPHLSICGFTVSRAKNTDYWLDWTWVLALLEWVGECTQGCSMLSAGFSLLLASHRNRMLSESPQNEKTVVK